MDVFVNNLLANSSEEFQFCYYMNNEVNKWILYYFQIASKSQ